MSRWTHSICVDCWNKREPSQPVPPGLTNVGTIGERCCFCGKAHASGIYVRDDPARLACHGEHP